MPNRSSHAGHVPQRTCVACRKKANKESFLRMVVLDRNLYFDLTAKLPRRGFYVCDDNQCLAKLDNWLKKKLRKADKGKK